MDTFRTGATEFDWMLAETMAFDPPVSEGRFDAPPFEFAHPAARETSAPLFAVGDDAAPDDPHAVRGRRA